MEIMKLRAQHIQNTGVTIIQFSHQNIAEKNIWYIEKRYRGNIAKTI